MSRGVRAADVEAQNRARCTPNFYTNTRRRRTYSENAGDNPLEINPPEKKPPNCNPPEMKNLNRVDKSTAEHWVYVRNILYTIGCIDMHNS